MLFSYLKNNRWQYERELWILILIPYLSFSDGWHRYDVFWDIIGWQTFPHATGGQWQGAATLNRRILSFSIFFLKKKEKTSGTDLQATQSCVGLKERGALSLLKVKIVSFFPTMTLSHEYSTSPTSSSSSPPSYTQQLFKRSTRGHIQGM